MYTYKLTISYEGTVYSGWQMQSNAPSIQQTIVDRLKVILKNSEVVLIGSGRTDAGVHALNQVAHFRHSNAIDLRRLQRALNGMLPSDIRIKSIESVSSDFHAQYSAKGKEYHYHLYLDPIMDPFRRHHCWHCYEKIDLQILKEASKLFIGTHNFTSFSNKAEKGAAAKNPVRTIYRLDICEEDGGVRLEFEGNGFLYKMVRNIVGTLVNVAKGKRPISDIPRIFNEKNRQQASNAAPPQGLFLVRVHYE